MEGIQAARALPMEIIVHTHQKDQAVAAAAIMTIHTQHIHHQAILVQGMNMIVMNRHLHQVTAMVPTIGEPLQLHSNQVSKCQR